MKNNLIWVMILVVLMVLTVIQVASDPPFPKNVVGKIFHNDMSGVENGIPVIINNTNLSQIFYTEVFAPPVPQLAGAYSLTLNGSIGDILTLTAYNDTHYGVSQGMLVAGSTEINATLNITRDSETNVSIVYPENHSLYNTSNRFNISVNISVLGRDGQNCNVTLIVTNETIVSFPSGTNYTNPLGSISVGVVETTHFEMYSNAVGTVNVTAIGECSTDGLNFEGLNTDVLENITIQDVDAPEINVIAPDNNSINKTSNNIVFLYNVSDASVVENCSLYINDIFNDSDTPIQKDTTLNFTKTMSNGNYTWNIICIDEYLNSKDTGIYFHNVSVFYPIITEINVIPMIVLNAGGIKTVECNLTVEEGNGAAEIDNVNATFYSYTVTDGSSDDNNTHYTNSSCDSTGTAGNFSNYTCSYSTMYYAINGTWYCNATAYDIDGLSTINQTNTTIDTLYALNTSADIINFGNLAAGVYSNDELLNITNFGNQPINISTFGYGGNDPIAGGGAAMLCDSGDNISVNNERYALQSAQSFFIKTPLTSINQDMGFTLQKQTDPAVEQDNTTYWQLYVSAQELGLCNGTIRFTATST